MAKAKEAAPALEAEDLLAELDITAPETPEEQTDTDDALKSLQDQLDVANRKAAEEEKLRVAAEDRATKASEARAKLETEKNKATDDVASAYEDRINAQETALESALNSATVELAAAKEAYRRARENGQIDEETAASERIATASYDVRAFTAQKNQFKTEVTNWRENVKAAKEQAAAQPQMGEATKNWINTHPRFNTDVEYNEHTQALHRAAIRLGKGQESPEYFKYIEDGLDKIYGEKKVESKKEVEDPPASSTATPASRESAPAGGAPPDKKKPTFTAREMEIIRLRAEEDNITVEKAAAKYAAHRTKLQADGIIGRA